MATDVERIVEADSQALSVQAPRPEIRLRVNDMLYSISADEIAQKLADDKMPDFLTGKGQYATGKAAMLRSGIKSLLPIMWPFVTGMVKAFNVAAEAETGIPNALPMPDLKTRHPDALIYAVRYIESLILSVLCATEWQAHGEPVDGDGRHVRLTRLSGAAGPTAATGATAEAADSPNN